MSSRIVLNSTILNELTTSNTLYLQKKFTKKDVVNYFFVPNIGLKLYKAKISWIDPFKKHVSFSFNKYESSSLLDLLKSVYTKLIILFKAKTGTDTLVSPFYFEKGDNFFIRCYLPNTKGKYNIESLFNNIPEQFSIPRLLYTYDVIIVDIRNIWVDSTRAGFNLELKEVASYV